MKSQIATLIYLVTCVSFYQATAQADPPAPIPNVEPATNEMPLRTVFSYDRVKRIGLPALDAPLVTLARKPNDLSGTMSSFIVHRELDLQPAVATQETVMLLVSPNLDAGKFWHPARVHRDKKNITLVAESWTDSAVRKQNLPRQSIYVVSLGKLDPGTYSFTLRVRDMYCDFNEHEDPQYSERSIQTASTVLRVPKRETDEGLEVSLPTIVAKNLNSVPGNGRNYQRVAGKPGRDAHLRRGQSSAVIYTDGKGGGTLPGAVSVESYSNPKYWRGREVKWVRVRGPVTGLFDTMSVREIEWVGRNKVIIRLDSWRSRIDENPSRQGVMFVPLKRGFLSIRKPGEYEVQVEWNLLYDKDGKFYTRYTLDNIDEADVPGNVKSDFKALSEAKGAKFTLATAKPNDDADNAIAEVPHRKG